MSDVLKTTVGRASLAVVLVVGALLASGCGGSGPGKGPGPANQQGTKDSQGDGTKDSDAKPAPGGADGAAGTKARVEAADARVRSLERQKRDWLQANSGRAGASGKKVGVWPNERLLDQARQEYEMARREYEQSK